MKGDQAHGNSSIGMLNEASSMTLRGKLNANDGIRSTNAFMTSVTPRDGPSIAFASAEIGSNADSQVKLATIESKKRKVFGANDYLER